MSHGTIPAGSVIERVYYAVPQHYTTGDKYPTFLAATREALVKRDRLKEQVAEGYPNHPNLDRIVEDAVRPQIVVDLRWVIKYPDGEGIDTMIERTNVYDLSVEHCDRMEAMSR